jgi:hypothetical protein
MDDMYQYAASAVDSNNKSTNTVPEEDDVIIKAFTNMGWGKKWSSLVDTVKKQVRIKENLQNKIKNTLTCS